MSRTVSCIVLGLLWSGCVFGEADPAPGPDVLIFKNGEKLIGHFRSATAAKVVFASDSAGVVTVDWSKVQELHSAARFAAIPKSIEVRNSGDTEKVPRGTVSMKDQKLEVSASPAAAPQSLPLAEVSSVMDEKTFDLGFEPQSFWKGWTGTATLGASLLQGTQESRTVSSMVSLQRSSPSEGWLPARFKTLVTFNSSYSKFMSPDADPVKTNILHGEVEEDYYLSPRAFLLAGATFDHNYLQGLDLMQGYGAGAGVVAVKGERDRFEVRLGAGFTDQQWTDPSENRKFFGMRIGEFYSHHFRNGAVFDFDAGLRPGVSYGRAFFAGANASLVFPVYKRFAMNVTGSDTFVNNPPPLFKKNVFQITFGASYMIR